MSIQVRAAEGSDYQAICEEVIAAFGNEEGHVIAELISELMIDPSAQPVLALVATSNDKVVGHILFTKVTIEGLQRPAPSMILAPLSVHPDVQNRGIGGQLINEGLKQLAAAGVELVFVLGHPGYYPKYGFTPAGAQGLEAPYAIPSEHADAWMVQALQPEVIGTIRGTVSCADALDDPKYWRE